MKAKLEAEVLDVNRDLERLRGEKVMWEMTAKQAGDQRGAASTCDEQVGERLPVIVAYKGVFTSVQCHVHVGVPVHAPPILIKILVIVLSLFSQSNISSPPLPPPPPKSMLTDTKAFSLCIHCFHHV